MTARKNQSEMKGGAMTQRARKIKGLFSTGARQKKTAFHFMKWKKNKHFLDGHGGCARFLTSPLAFCFLSTLKRYFIPAKFLQKWCSKQQ